ncbi:MAG: RcpC/CpaB family pilus assembly protein [Phycisphaeraceae bacterium]
MPERPPSAMPPVPPPAAGGAKVVLAALGLGLLAVIMLTVYIQGVKNQVAAEQFTVWVLSKPVLAGQRIGTNDWVPVKVPRKEVFTLGFESLGAYTSPTGSDENLRALITGGKQWEVNAVKGQLIVHGMFEKGAGRTEMAMEEGKVRIALPIQSKLTPGGLRPGDYVDIAAPIQTGGIGPEVMIVMQYVQVKAVGNYTLAEEGAVEGSRSIRSYGTVSIDVEPEVATQLSTLEKMVRIYGQFELYLTGPRPPKWDPGKINPEVQKHLRKSFPSAG